tara:strand:- start:163 stop:720 length:558 start_codon:yes stop_codon:yes gene_type:complete
MVSRVVPSKAVKGLSYVKLLIMIVEEFKDIPGHEGVYQVSNLGRVKSLRFNKEKLLKHRLNKAGYHRVNLHKSGEQKTIFIHQLVASAFLGHTINNSKLVVDHINNDKSNNNIMNLQLISNRENSTKDKVGGTSKYIGVSWRKDCSKWNAEISIKGKTIKLGLFTCELAAAKAYQDKLEEEGSNV